MDERGLHRVELVSEALTWQPSSWVSRKREQITQRTVHWSAAKQVVRLVTTSSQTTHNAITIRVETSSRRFFWLFSLGFI